MSDRRLEQLSAMIDGQLKESECHHLMDESTVDPGLKAAWLRYHLIGDALRDSLPKHIHFDFAKKVSLALEKEPAILVPKRQRQTLPWFKPTLGLAMAASVVAAIGLGVYKLGTNLPQKQPEPLAENMDAQLEAQFSPLPIATVRWNSERPKRPPRLNSYLVNHNQFKAEAGMQGVSPYYRIIGYETSP